MSVFASSGENRDKSKADMMTPLARSSPRTSRRLADSSWRWSSWSKIPRITQDACPILTYIQTLIASPRQWRFRGGRSPSRARASHSSPEYHGFARQASGLSLTLPCLSAECGPHRDPTHNQYHPEQQWTAGLHRRIAGFEGRRKSRRGVCPGICPLRHGPASLGRPHGAPQLEP